MKVSKRKETDPILSDGSKAISKYEIQKYLSMHVQPSSRGYSPDLLESV